MVGLVWYEITGWFGKSNLVDLVWLEIIGWFGFEIYLVGLVN